MKELTIKTMPKLPFEVNEALNQLRVNLGFCGDNIRTIMVTSSTPNEGKSFITVQLWKMMAELGSRTLLIDADLRNSELRTRYGISATEKIVGVAHYLSGKVELQDALYQTNIPNAYMMPLATNVGNPTILLESPRFDFMLKTCAGMFDYVLVDTPPIGNVADALNIATHCDGTLLVVRSDGVPRKLVKNSVDLLKRTGTPLLGIALNRADLSGKSDSYYYSRYYSQSGYYNKYGAEYGAGSKTKK